MVSRFTKNYFAQFKEALLTVMKTKSFDEVHVKDICNCAKLSRQYFYRFYVDKIDLARDIITCDIVQSLEGNVNFKNSINYIIGAYQSNLWYYKLFFTSKNYHDFSHLFHRLGKAMLYALFNSSYQEMTKEQIDAIDFYLYGITTIITECIIHDKSLDVQALDRQFLVSMPQCIQSLKTEEITKDQYIYRIEKELKLIREELELR
ncbi:MAG: hypothetical protein MJ236_04435 [Clostridia bacterium]|nr:hypothetical protein [Clostridia bacterium]